MGLWVCGKENRTMKTIAQQLNIKDFPFEIKDTEGRLIYIEYESGYWAKRLYEDYGNTIYHQDSEGIEFIMKITELSSIT